MTRRPVADFLRFTRGERWVHKTTAILMGICLMTAAILYIDPLSRITGHRAVVEWVHVIAGIGLPIPFLVGLLSKAFRADAQRLNRFTRTDWRWLRSRTRRRDRLPVGKFNAGQKLNANFQLGGILVMLGTGTIMRFANHWPVYLRTGATFVHDWLAYGLLAVVIGHIVMANRDPDALRGMRTGYVPAAWAKREHAAWAEREHAAWVARERASAKATDAS
ncbi:MAG TPA: cytochrome b/b6 domain-containing protein [Acidothermaceae bacterium]|jgi:formate dehydrogenase subunit gamma